MTDFETLYNLSGTVTQTINVVDRLNVWDGPAEEINKYKEYWVHIDTNGCNERAIEKAFNKAVKKLLPFLGHGMWCIEDNFMNYGVHKYVYFVHCLEESQALGIIRNLHNEVKECFATPVHYTVACNTVINGVHYFDKEFTMDFELN